jgi:hypothetical protein
MKKHLLFLLFAGLLFTACNRTHDLALAPETIFDDHGLHVITSFHNERARTISVLYGNDDALVNAGKDRAGHTTGEVYKLVTWDLKANPLWFGSNINGSLISEETVSVLPGRSGVPEIGYAFEKLSEKPGENAVTSDSERISFIFAQRASVFP